MASTDKRAGKGAATSVADASSNASKEAKATSAAKASKKDSKKESKKGGKPGLLTRIKTYFKNVRSEVKRVVWPTKPELIKYTGAVVGMLIFFGLLIALVDAAIVPVLYAFSGLR